MRDQFLVELTEERAARIQDLSELNKLFTAWTETVYHVREHSETGQPPLARWEAGGPFPLPAGGHGGAPASGQPGREQGQGQDGLGAGEEDSRG